jgi:hypothetical protein
MKRIHVVKEFGTEEGSNDTLADRINGALGQQGEPRVVALCHYIADVGKGAEARMLVVIERDERRSEPRGPSRVTPSIRKGIERRKHGNGDDPTPAEPLS